MQNMLEEIRHYLEERGWTDLKPANLAKSIVIEGAELLENFQWDHPTTADVLADETKMQKVREELADVLIYCYELALFLELNPDDIMRAKLEHNKKKFPAEAIKAGGQDAYWAIKAQYRQAAKANTDPSI